jgi:hypothetical protein
MEYYPQIIVKTRSALDPVAEAILDHFGDLC